MDLKITAEWLLSFDDGDYEPSGLMTPRDRAELERRKVERLAEARRIEEPDAENTKQAYSPETAATTVQ